MGERGGHHRTEVAQNLESLREFGDITAPADDLPDRGGERGVGLGRFHREVPGGHTVDRSRDRRHGIVPGRSGGVRGGTVRGDLRPRHALLRHGDRIEPTTPDGDRPASDLTESLGHPVEDLRTLADHPFGAHDPGGLLVGEESQQQGATGDDALPTIVTDHRDGHAEHVLHVNGSTPVEPPVTDFTGERRDRPVLGDRRDHIDMPVDHQAAGVRIRALDAREEAATPGHGLHQLTGDPDLVEVLGDPAAHPGLTVPDGRGLAGVGGIDGNQVRGDRDGLGVQPLARLPGHSRVDGHPKHFPSPR